MPHSSTMATRSLDGGVEMTKIGAVLAGGLLFLVIFGLANSNFGGSGYALA